MRNMIKSIVIASALSLPFTAFATPEQKPAQPAPAAPTTPAQPAPSTATPAQPSTIHGILAKMGKTPSKAKTAKKATAKKPAPAKHS